jgi:hypothetical protein
LEFGNSINDIHVSKCISRPYAGTHVKF